MLNSLNGFFIGMDGGSFCSHPKKKIPTHVKGEITATPHDLADTETLSKTSSGDSGKINLITFI